MSNLSLLLLRLILGIVLALHGSQKLFGTFGGSGLDKWNTYITSLNIPFTNVKFPSTIGTLAATLEFICGLLLIFGIGVKTSSLLMIIFLLFAIKLSHLDKGFFSQNGGYEYALTLLVISLVLFIEGGGKYQLYDKY